MTSSGLPTKTDDLLDNAVKVLSVLCKRQTLTCSVSTSQSAAQGDPAAATAATVEIIKHEPPKDQIYDYFLILDFEATCLKDMRIKPQEIIEFPCILFNAKTLKVEKTFHTYVKPVVKPMLSPFCVKLTKIQQAQIDPAPEFHQVIVIRKN